MNISKSLKKGFTLVELLVVVAIIAIIGAGVAVSYRDLSDKAATAMEISDCNILQKVIAQWSVINDNKLINGLDLLVDENGNKYCAGGPGYFSMDAVKAPKCVLDALSGAGMTIGYRHLSKSGNANNSTFTTGQGGDVDTTKTAVMLEYVSPKDISVSNMLLEKETLTKVQKIANAEGAWLADGHTIGDVLKRADNTEEDPCADTRYADKKIDSEIAFRKLQKEAQTVANAGTGEPDKQNLKLCFLNPYSKDKDGDGYHLDGSFVMDQTFDIVTNIGMRPEDIANPMLVDDDGKYTGPGQYFLVVMGLGRFASIYSGRSVSLDLPAYAKRNGQDTSTYNRYLVVIRVPVGSGYDMMSRSGEDPKVVAVLTPMLYSNAKLRDKYISAENNMKD